MAAQKRLRRAGFSAPFTLLHVDPAEDADELSTAWHVARSVTPLVDVDRLVWLLFVERRAKRRVNDLAYFVDVEAGVLLFPYDTRGMDLVAADAATLRPAYQQYNDWLLDHDRSAMDARTAAAAP